MKKLADIFTRGLSIEVSKTAVDAIWSQDDGVDAYSLCGKIIMGCGVAWAAISFVPFVLGTSPGDYLWMPIVGMVQIVVGALVVILARKSNRFQAWALRSFEKDLDRWAKMQSQLVIGDKTMRATYGDAVALAVVAVIAAIIVIVMAIGSVQGWVQ